MHALTVCFWPVFPVSGRAPWRLKVTFAWQIQIGRRLAVLRGNRPALTPGLWGDEICSLGVIYLIDFLSVSPYRHAKGQQTTGAWYVTGGHTRLPAACVPVE